MIYHAITLDPATGQPARSWWAVHAETLTPVFIDGSRFPYFHLDIIAPPEGQVIDFASHPEASFDPHAIRREVMASIRQHFHPKSRAKSSRVIPRKDAKVPEYLLILDGAGENPACFRTSDPHLIIPASQPDESILGQPRYWRTAIDMPATGWEYWWTDCQIAWDKLAPAFIEAGA